MKFFYDSEFIEGFLPNRLLGFPLPNLLSKRRHAIDLISIAIVAEDGEVYEAISNEYNYDDASDWVKDNVITPLYTSTVYGDMRNMVDDDNFHKWYGTSNKQIANEIKEFIYRKVGHNPYTCPSCAGNYMSENLPESSRIDLYGYFSAYDHVLLSSLFGSMMDLPKWFPMYTIDLQQELSENAEHIYMALTKGLGANHKATMSHVKLINYIQKSDAYPKLRGEHLAVNDAKWNKKLFEFLQKY